MTNWEIKIWPDWQKWVWFNGCFWLMMEEKTKQELSFLIKEEIEKMYYKLWDFALYWMNFK